MGHDQAVGGEPPGRGARGGPGPAQPAGYVAGEAVGEQGARQLGGVADGERADGPAPRQRLPAGGGDGLHEPGRGREAAGPHLAQAAGQRRREQVGVDGVHVDLAPAVVGVVEPAVGVLAQEGGHPRHEIVEDRGVDVEPEPGAGRLAAGQHHGVVAGQETGVEQLDPLGAVGGLGHHLGRGRFEGAETAEARRGLGHAVREEGVGAGGVDRGQPLVDQRAEAPAGDLPDAGLVQQTQGEDEVGVGVGLHPVPGQGGGQGQPGGDGEGQALHHVEGRRDQGVGDRRGGGSGDGEVDGWGGVGCHAGRRYGNAAGRSIAAP